MNIALSVDQIFTYAGDIIDALLPVVYVVGGIGLGFVIVNRIIAAFR